MPRVLLAEASLPMRRVMREAMTAFRQCEVDDAPSGERAFELALQRPYELFLFSLELADLNGDQLDRLLAQAYPLAHLGRHTSPPVIFLASNATHPSLAPLRTNARVLGILSLPPKIDQILSLTQRILPPRNDAGAPPFPPHVP
jgi:CheY-like chemotaxis protein